MKLLFYSTYCKHCNNLFSFKENDPDFKKIKKICVDKDKNLPPQITKVPTLVSDELLAPITGKEVFAYFNCLEMFNQPTYNVNYWKDKAIKRPVVDNFIPGREQILNYQPIDKIKGKKDLELELLQKQRLI